jgi:hypothetical protein
VLDIIGRRARFHPEILLGLTASKAMPALTLSASMLALADRRSTSSACAQDR